MNVLVDLLAKQALVASIVERDFIRGHIPFELLRVTIQGKRLTGSPRKAFEDYWGEREARCFYHDKELV